MADHEQVGVVRLEGVRRGHEPLPALLELREEAAHAIAAAIGPAVVGDELHLADRAAEWPAPPPAPGRWTTARARRRGARPRSHNAPFGYGYADSCGDLGRRPPARAGAAGDERGDLARSAPMGGQGQGVRVGTPAAQVRLRGAGRRRARRADPRRPGGAPDRQGGAARRRPERLLHHPALRRLPGGARPPEEIGIEDLEELVVEAWLARAPKRLAKEYLSET